jgi:superfamily II DNA/RNA helicase
VQQSLIWTSSRRKREVLDALIKREDEKNAFIFLNRKRDVDELAKWLKGKGYSAAPMHGDMVQSVRTVTLQGFKDGKITLLVCSDVAARGLDIQGVSHVFNYDLPFNADDYVHRIGRTGRAGMAGRALSIAARDDDEKLVENIERLIKRAIPLEEIEVNEERAPRAASSRSAQPRPAREERSRSEGSGRARPVREVVPEEVDELADLGLAHGATNQRRAEKFSHRQQKPAVRNNRPPRQDDEDGPNSFSQDDLPAFLRR